MDDYAEFSLDALLANIVASSAIESEVLDVYEVRSSLATWPRLLNVVC